MKFGNFTRRKSGLVSERPMRSTSNTVLETGSQEQAPENPTPIKSFTKDTARSQHLEHGAHLHRYWIRGLIGIFVPLAITVYWLIVWYVYLAPQPAGSTLLYGHSGGRWIFYSWFIIGIFGMNLSKYGLTGVEAGMLMEPRWAAKNTMQVMMHAEHSWSGPSGWMKSVKHLFVRGDKRPEPPTPLWTILAFLSILPVVAIPLTGLCYELKDGYHSTGTHPNVTGLDWSNVNSLAGAKLAGGIWKSGNNATIPGLGVIYTAPNVSRSQFPYLSKFPNSLPNYDGVEKLFITQQAEDPISGTSWGLLLSYNCSIVTSPSQFTILNQRKDGVAFLQTGGHQYYPNDTGINNAYINIRNDTSEFYGSYAPNYFVALEEGISQWPPVQTENGTEVGYADSALDSWGNATDTSYFWNHNTPGQYPEFQTRTVYEAALWQDVVDNVTKEALAYDLTLNGNLTDLYGNYYKPLLNNKVRLWSAIGVRCMSSSEVGTAKIDGRSSTYTDFQRTDTPIPDLSTNAPRLDVSAPTAVINDSLYDTESAEWVPNLFRSINSPVNVLGIATFNETARALGANETQIALALETAAEDGTLEELTAIEQVPLQTRYIQPEDLRQSLLRTYPAYVNEFLFNGGDDWHDKDGSLKHISNINPNVTSFVQKRLFEKGDILNFWVPGALLVVWAVISIVLTLMYGFRRRWSATLDSYSVLRFGADLANSIRNHPEFGVNMGFEECFVLRDLPGQIGDANVGFEPGHITLVNVGKETIADKTKMYM